MRWLWAWLTRTDNDRIAYRLEIEVYEDNARAQWLYLPHTAQEPRRG